MAETFNECRRVGLDFFDNAPLIFKSTATLPCSPEALFMCFEDADAWCDWVSVIRKVEWHSSRPFKVGTTRTVYMPAGIIAREEFIAWDKPAHMAFRFNQFNQTYLNAFAEDYRVKDLGGDRCQLSWTVAMEQTGVAGLVTPLVKPFVAWQLRRIMTDLETYLRTEGRRFCQRGKTHGQ